MNPRRQWIASQLSDLLERRTPPQAIRDKPELQRAEMGDLLDTVLSHAPRERYQDWWDKFKSKLLRESSTYSWPHPGDIEKVGRACREKPVGRGDDGWKPDPYKINAARMNAGEAVGDGWFYGREAVELLERGLVSQESMDAYRSGFWFSLLDVYGGKERNEAEPRKIEQRYRDRHDRAAEASGMPRYRVRIPAPRRITPTEDFA